MPNKVDWRDVALDDLARSGLNARDFQTLELEILTSEETEDFVGDHRVSYRIPYFDFNGRTIKYSRVRFLQGKRFQFAKLNGAQRYSQPANSAPHIYLPPYVDWRDVASDPSTPIVITEGEKKAALACKLGIPTLALGGVWSFMSKKRNQLLIPELEKIIWKDRDIEICFDSDVMHKAEVRLAMDFLAAELSLRSPRRIDFVFLDSEDTDGKTGLDDYLVTHGRDAFEQLQRHPHRSNAKIQQLNTKVCYVSKELRFFDVGAGKYFKHFPHVREAFAHEGEEFVDAKKKVPVIELWVKHPNRRTVDNVIYKPGEDEITETNELNLWRQAHLQPKKKKPTQWLELVDYVFRKPKYADWFLQWLAYPVQHPATKLLSAVFVYGKQQGVGKTFVVDPVMSYIYGEDNFARVTNDDLSDSFNSIVDRKQFVVADEVYISDFHDRHAVMGALKSTVTRETVNINEKNQPKVRRVDYANYYMSSNHKEALLLDPDDRRFFVVEAPNEKLEQSFYDSLDEDLRYGDLPNAVLHYLANLDLTDFNPKAAAMETVWRSEVIELSRTALDEFVDRLGRHPRDMFAINGRLPDLQLFRAEDLIRVYEQVYPTNRMRGLTVKKMGDMLKSVLPNRKVRAASDSPQFALYAVFDKERWEDARPVDWANHYMNHARVYGGKSRY